MNASTLPALPDERDKYLAKILEGVREGKSFAQLAAEHGVPQSTLNHWMLTKGGEKYDDAKEAGIVARILDANDRLENASTHLDVARARELGRLWCWLGERTVQRLAPKQEISGPGGGPIQVEDRELARRYAFIQQMVKHKPAVIDVDPIASTSASS